MLTLQIVMEYCPVGSVGDMMHITQQALREDQISYVCRCTLKGLAYLHAHRKIHRDIKPGNLLVNAAGQVKLGGPSSLLQEQLTPHSRLWSFRDSERADPKARHGDRHPILSGSRNYPRSRL